MAKRAGQPRFWRQANIGGGIDRRDGIITENLDRWHDLVNYRTASKRRIRRRPPCIDADAFDALSQGQVRLRGVDYVIAPKGVTPTVPSGVQAVAFDPPDHASGAWSLLAAMTFNGAVMALIRHAYPAPSTPFVDLLHVFDGKSGKPTYVEDPYCPTNWEPSRPLHIDGVGEIGAYDATFRPRLAVAGGRAYLSDPRGNAGFSRSGNARAWNDRTVDDFQDDGELWYFLTPADTGDFVFTVSEPYLNLIPADTSRPFQGWTLEYLDATGTWLPLEYVAALGGPGTYRLSSVAARNGTGTETRVDLRWDGGESVTVRFRAMLRAPGFRIERMPVFSVDAWGQVNTTTSGVASINGVFTTIETPEVAISGVTPPFAMPFAAGTYFAAWGHLSFTNANVGSGTLPNFGARTTPTYDQLPERNLVRPIAIITSPGVLASPTINAVSFVGGETLVTFSASVTTGDHIWMGAAGAGTYRRYLVKATGTANIRVTNHLDEDGDYTALIFATSTALNFGAGCTSVPYTFANESTAGSESAFYLERKLRYQLDDVGFEDAGTLPTAAQPQAGGDITALAARKDRLVVAYTGATQVWSVAGLPEEHVILDQGAIGTGSQVNPQPVEMLGTTVLAMARGIRSISLSGLNLDSMRDQNIGEPIVDLGIPQQLAATYWPWLGCYITAVLVDGALQFWALDNAPEEKLTAWCRWIVAGLTTVDAGTFVADEGLLYFRSGNRRYAFDAEATLFRDFADVEGNAYISQAVTHFSDMGEPFKEKQAIAVEMNHRGDCTIALRYNPRLPDAVTGPYLVNGTTAGERTVPVSVWGAGLGLVIESQDETGHEFDQYGLHFRTLGRP